jgi:ABC-2 type transport system ATP-binding protein
VTIVLTTHDMDEAAEMTDRVGIVDHGKLLALDTPSALIRGLSGQSVLEVTINKASGDTTDQVIAALVAIPGVERGEAVASGGGGFNGGPPTGMSVPAAAAPVMAAMPVMAPPTNGVGPVTLRLYIDGAPAVMLSPVVTVLTGRRAELSNVHIGEPSLEDVFIDLTGRSLR